MSDVSLSYYTETGAGPAGGSRRDLAVTALILGIAAFAWFGWGQAAAPAGWSVPLLIGSVAGLAVAAAGAGLARRLRSGASAMDSAQLRRRYWQVVAVEMISIAVGWGALVATGHPAYIPAWVLLVVGVHFLPLARLFRTPGLSLAGMLLVMIAVAAAVTGAAGGAAPSTVAGAGGGLVCLGYGAACCYQALRPAAGRQARRAS